MKGEPQRGVLVKAAAARRRTGVRQDGIHLAPDATLLIRADGTIADLNNYAADLFGYQREELLGRNLNVLIPERFRASHFHHFSNYQSNPQPRAMGSGMDLWGLRKDGSEFPVDIALSPRETPEGIQFAWSIRDLTPQLQFELLVTDLSARFARLPIESVDTEISQVIRKIVEFLGADRGSFGEFSADNSILTVSHTYNGPGIPPTPRTILNERLPWVASALLRGEVVNIERVPEDLPPEAAREREYFAAEGMKAGLAIPLNVGGRFAYAISVSSFTSYRKWPTGLIGRLQLLGEIFASAVARTRTQQALQEQLAFEHLVAEISTRFANLPIEGIDAEVTRSLQQITEFLGVDQAAYLKFSDELGTLISTHYYNAPGTAVPPPPSVLHTQFPWYTTMVRRGETIRKECMPDDLPPEAVNEKEYVVAKGMRSHLAIPINVDGSVAFVLAAVSFRSPRPWPDAVVHRLRLLGELFAGALMRRRAQEALQESEAKFRLLAETATCGIGIYQGDRFQYVNPRAAEITGYSVDEFLSMGVEQLVHPDSRATVLERAQRRLQGKPVPGRYEIKILTKQGEERWVDFAAAETLYRGIPAIIGTAFDVTQRRQAQDALHELSGRLIRAQEEERARIARELHDDLSQRLALLAIELQQASQESAESTSMGAGKLPALLEQTQEIATDIHRLSRELHPSQLEALGLVPALRSFCGEFSKQRRLCVEIAHEGIPSSLSPDVTLCVYRTVQESLQNAAQHGRARRIQVHLVGTSEAIQLTVVDDGTGFDVAAQANSTGLGLISMRERARLVGGDFAVHSQPHQGTRIEVRVPLAASQP